MTAGKGIVHSEMPHGDDENVGLQLWINLKAKEKMIEPQYQELLSKDIPHVEKDGVHVAVIAGESMGISVSQSTVGYILYYGAYIFFVVTCQNKDSYDVLGF